MAWTTPTGSTLRPFQEDGVRMLHRTGGRALLADEVGLGKAQPDHCRVLTPGGWEFIGNLEVGDFVIGADGRPTRVTGVFPQGIKTVYRVVMSDGSATECCEEHLWTLVCPEHIKHRREEPKTVPLSVVREMLNKRGPNYAATHTPLVRPVQFGERPVPLHPYLVGLLIADGCLLYSSPSFSTRDAEIVERLRGMIPAGLSIKPTGGCDWRISKDTPDRTSPNPVTVALRDLGLWGKKSPQKEIPHLYRVNSVEVRRQLLYGLMDGDGTVSEGGAVVSYTSTSKRLARQVRELVWSLGGACRETSRVTSYRGTDGSVRRGLRSYTLNVSMPPDHCPFLLKRKADRYVPRTKYPPMKKIRV